MKKWGVKVPSGQWMAGIHWFTTKHSAVEFSVGCVEIERKKNPNAQIPLLFHHSHYPLVK